MARKVTPVKGFNWRIEINGIDSFECQSVTIPSAETEAIEHGAGGAIVKTAGQVNVGDLTFAKLKPTNVADNEAWEWMKRAQDSVTGNGQEPQFAEKDITIKLLSVDNETTLYEYFCTGVWVKKIEYTELSKTASENVMETVTCSVDSVDQQRVPSQIL